MVSAIGVQGISVTGKLPLQTVHGLQSAAPFVEAKEVPVMQPLHSLAPFEAAWKPTAQGVQVARPDVPETAWLKPPDGEKEPATHKPAHALEVYPVASAMK